MALGEGAGGMGADLLEVELLHMAHRNGRMAFRVGGGAGSQAQERQPAQHPHDRCSLSVSLCLSFSVSLLCRVAALKEGCQPSLLCSFSLSLPMALCSAGRFPHRVALAPLLGTVATARSVLL